MYLFPLEFTYTVASLSVTFISHFSTHHEPSSFLAEHIAGKAHLRLHPLL